MEKAGGVHVHLDTRDIQPVPQLRSVPLELPLAEKALPWIQPHITVVKRNVRNLQPAEELDGAFDSHGLSDRVTEGVSSGVEQGPDPE